MASWSEFFGAGYKVVVDKLYQYLYEDNGCESGTVASSGRIYPEVGLFTEYSYMFSEPTYIIDNLYLGSSFNAASYTILKNNNINVIFNITNEITNYYPNDFIYHKYPLNDNNKDSIEEYLEEIYETILNHQQNTPGNILVHCYMGRSRSASVIIYYIMKKLSMNVNEAMEYVLNKRLIINPTIKFSEDLTNSFIK